MPRNGTFLRAATGFLGATMWVVTRFGKTFLRLYGIAKNWKNNTKRRWTAMAERNTKTMAQQKIYIAEQIWLHYYNDYLFGKGMITEEVRNRLRFKIDSRKPSAY